MYTALSFTDFFNNENSSRFWALFLPAMFSLTAGGLLTVFRSKCSLCGNVVSYGFRRRKISAEIGQDLAENLSGHHYLNKERYQDAKHWSSQGYECSHCGYHQSLSVTNEKDDRK